MFTHNTDHKVLLRLKRHFERCYTNAEGGKEWQGIQDISILMFNYTFKYTF